MNAILTPRLLHGTVAAPPSKSQCHRALLAAALCHGETVLQNCGHSRDLDATIGALAALGASVQREGSALRVCGFSRPAESTIRCGGSGTTLRFFLPVLCALGQETLLTMEGRLPQRPLEPLWSELLRHGGKLSRPAETVISVGGKLTNPAFSLEGNVSSQFLSGLPFALPLLGGGTLKIVGELQSASYLDMTKDTLSRFGITVTADGQLLTVSGTYISPGVLTMEGDWSQAAYWITANRLGCSVECSGLAADSLQGDRCISSLPGTVLDAGSCPDLVPILAVYAALRPCTTTRIVNAARLRFKESDRLAATAAMLRDLGAELTEQAEGLTICGKKQLSGGRVDAFGDHRIAMSAAIASVGCQKPVTILGAEAVCKSYPRFWEDYLSLGGLVQWEDACE